MIVRVTINAECTAVLGIEQSPAVIGGSLTRGAGRRDGEIQGCSFRWFTADMPGCPPTRDRSVTAIELEPVNRV